MKIDDIPQDNSASYHGHRKVIYGTRDGTTKRPPATVGRTKPTPPKWQCANSMPKRRPRAKPSKKVNTHRCTTICSAAVMTKPAWPWRQAYGNGSCAGISSRSVRQTTGQNPAKIRRCLPNQHRRPQTNQYLKPLMITLHSLDQSRALRIVWLLEILGTPYRLQTYRRHPDTLLAPEELKAIHPLGKSPLLDDDGFILAESGAITDYLIQTYGNGL